MRYEILEADSPAELELLVNRHIERGWKPQGGVVPVMQLTPSGDRTLSYNFYLQAMVKE